MSKDPEEKIKVLDDRAAAMRAAHEAQKIVERWGPKLTDEAVLTVNIWQPDPKEQEYHAAIVAHLHVGKSPRQVLEMLLQTLMGWEAKFEKEAKDGPKHNAG